MPQAPLLCPLPVEFPVFPDKLPAAGNRLPFEFGRFPVFPVFPSERKEFRKTSIVLRSAGAKCGTKQCVTRRTKRENGKRGKIILHQVDALLRPAGNSPVERETSGALREDQPNKIASVVFAREFATVRWQPPLFIRGRTMTEPPLFWTAPRALIHLCFGDEQLACDARDDTARRVAFRFEWERIAGLGRRPRMEIGKAADLLLELLKSGEVEASGLDESAGGPSGLRRRIDPRLLVGYHFGFDLATELQLTPKTEERIRRPAYGSLQLSAEPLVERFPSREETPLPPYSTLAEVASKSVLSLEESLRFVSSRLDGAGMDVASVISGPFWAMSDAALERLEIEDKEWADRARKTRAEAASTIVSWLQSGAATASSATGEIPRPEWSRYEIDWWRSELGPSLDPSRYGSIFIDRERLALLAKGAPEAVKSPSAEVDPYRTGLPGPRSGIPLVLAEHRQRLAAGEAETSVTAEANYLCRWFAKNHPNAPPLSTKTIENRIREQHRKRRSPEKPPN